MQDKMGLFRQVGEEIISEPELEELIKKKAPVAYDGFEPSGVIHIAQGLMRAINIKKMLKAGCTFKILIADWHAWANNKMDGDLEKIRKQGLILLQIWKAMGLEDGIEYLWASDLVKDDKYWKIVMQVARNSTMNRVIRCSEIMGRSHTESLLASQILYPCMQAADIFYLKADITQLGMDQRKVNMLAREIGPKIGFYKPIVISHHMLMGLHQPPGVAEKSKVVEELKMSKSKPDSAIFMTDDAGTVRKKINKAYCPEGEVNKNPVLEYCKYIIYESQMLYPQSSSVSILGYSTYERLQSAFEKKEVHPIDLKREVAEKLIELLQPVQAVLSRQKADVFF